LLHCMLVYVSAWRACSHRPTARGSVTSSQTTGWWYRGKTLNVCFNNAAYNFFFLAFLSDALFKCLYL